MSSVKLNWCTPDAERSILKMARVSSPNPNSEKIGLINYLIRNKHWSPFEMANMCVEITTTRTISRQILRHRSFSFQEFSQRYAIVTPWVSEARRQDTKNRQNSIDDFDEVKKEQWINTQRHVFDVALSAYESALEKGIAKEQARVLLPEGLTPTTLHMNGTLRSWIHYIKLREAHGTQKEHVEIATSCKNIFINKFPLIARALQWTE